MSARSKKTISRLLRALANKTIRAHDPDALMHREALARAFSDAKVERERLPANAAAANKQGGLQRRDAIREVD